MNDKIQCNKEVPPGTVGVGKVFIDQFEVCNFYWMEYVVWLRQVYGESSEEYNQSLIHSSFGKGFDSLFNMMLFDQKYREYPVIGITFEQAKKFSVWRSDRVMEYLLVREGIIPQVSNPCKDSVFTIERYFTGKYYNIEPDTSFIYYPVYDLPDTNVLRNVLSISDSLIFMKCSYQSGEGACVENQGDSILTFYRPVNKTMVLELGKKYISGLQDNVVEMTSVEGVVYNGRGDWSVNKTNAEVTAESSRCIGFRNVCHFKKWVFP